MNATSLQGLVAQLANFESNFIHILTQAALRLSDLSGREIFLLVKSQTGSYFAGSRELCAAYKIGTLMPSSADEVHIKKEDACETCAQNKNAASTAATTPVDSNPTSTAIPLPAAPVAPPPPSIAPLQRKRAANDVAAPPNLSTAAPSPAKKPNLATENNFSAFQIDQNHSSSSTSASTTSATPTSNAISVKSEPQSDTIAMDDDDDDDDVIWEEVDAATSWAAIGQQQIEQLRAQGIHLDLNSGLDSTSAASDAARRFCPSAKELFEAKIMRLKLLRPDEVFVKRSREHQLLSTVMYGYGRDLALEYMEENRKIQEEREKASKENDKGSSSSSTKPPALLSKANFFHKKYENFVLQFPELTGFKTKIKRSKNQIVSARNYIQNIAQKAFYKNVKKEEDKELLVKKAAEESGKTNGGGKGGGGGGGSGGNSGNGSVSGTAENGGFGSECSNHSMPSPEPKVEPAEPLINPHTGLPDPDYDPYDDDDDDDDDIIFL